MIECLVAMWFLCLSFGGGGSSFAICWQDDGSPRCGFTLTDSVGNLADRSTGEQPPVGESGSFWCLRGHAACYSLAVPEVPALGDANPLEHSPRISKSGVNGSTRCGTQFLTRP